MCLLTHENRIYVARRKERMLNGLYVFHLIEEESRPGPAEQLLRESGFQARFIADLGEAKHVFTHRVWNMRILHFALEAIPEGAQMVDINQMNELPFPTAVKKAVEEARKLLEGAKA